jgi:hypothetical protein
MEERRAPVRRDAGGAQAVTASAFALAFSLALVGARAAVACPLTPADGTPLAGDGVQLAWRTADGQPIGLSQPFSLQVRLCPASAELRAVDATMPAHRHGMNYRPSLQALGDGRWRADGLLWHMRGGWELRWDVWLDGRLHTLRQAVDLP